MCGYVRLGTTVKDLEELGNLIDSRRRVVNSGTQGVDEPSKKVCQIQRWSLITQLTKLTGLLS
jgi:hypothetical protein